MQINLLNMSAIRLWLKDKGQDLSWGKVRGFSILGGGGAL